MANDFYTPEQIASVAIALVRDDVSIASTFTRDFESDFGGGKGTTVNVKVPAVLSARTRALGATSAITVDDLTEDVIPVTMDEMVYSAVRLSDEDLTFDLDNFSARVLDPQAVAIAERIENKCVAQLEAVAETSGLTWASDPADTFVEARKALRDLGVPSSMLYAVVGTDVAAELLKSDALRKVSDSGSSEALRDAVIGRIAGFTVIESNRLTSDDDGIFYHKAGFTLATRAPVVPEGAPFGASVGKDGFAFRVIRDYDSSTLADRQVVSTFVGTQAIEIRNASGGSAGTPFVPAVRIDSTP